MRPFRIQPCLYEMPGAYIAWAFHSGVRMEKVSLHVSIIVVPPFHVSPPGRGNGEWHLYAADRLLAHGGEQSINYARDKIELDYTEYLMLQE